jgi:hypothetical protein
VLANAEAGAEADAGLAHPVHRRSPGQVADLAGVPGDLGDVLLWFEQPPGGQRAFGKDSESAGVQNPRD